MECQHGLFQNRDRPELEGGVRIRHGRSTSILLQAGDFMMGERRIMTGAQAITRTDTGGWTDGWTDGQMDG